MLACSRPIAGTHVPRPCAADCGAADPKWDDRARRVVADREWPTAGFEIRELLPIEELLKVHKVAASVGVYRHTKVGFEKPHFATSIFDEYQRNIADRIDPIYTAARFAKHIGMHRPFYDANRRTAFTWAATHFDSFGIAIKIDTSEAAEFRQKLKQRPFGEVYEWFARETGRART